MNFDIRLVDNENNNLGVMSMDKAIEHADNTEYSLILINDDSTPKTYKLIDEDRHRFTEQKKKKQKAPKIKEIKFKINISKNDLLIKTKKIKEFLNSRQDS